MRSILGRRPLAFEQMEQRLALSATPVSDYLVFRDLDLSGLYVLAADKVVGGNITVEGALNWAHNRSTFDYSDYFSTGDASFIDIWDGEILITGPVYKPDDGEPGMSSEVGSQVTPIAQPQIGHGEIAEGIIAVAEIFRPVKVAPAIQSEQPALRTAAADSAISSSADESWRAISLSRGRDIHLEVAILSTDNKSNKQGQTDLSHELSPLIYQQTLLRREAERDSSTTSQERTTSPQHLPALPAQPQQEVLQPQDDRQQLPKNESTEESRRTAQDEKLPADDEFSLVGDPRDQLFAVWGEDESLSDEVVALRTDSQPTHSATWPVLAALATTGWFARNRRLKSVLPSQRLPERRK